MSLREGVMKRRGWWGKIASGSNLYFTFSPPAPRKTRRADIALCAARAEPVPGAWGEGAPGCPSIWEVSGGGDRKTGIHLCGWGTVA